MAICNYCRKDMLAAAGCTTNLTVRFGRKTMSTIEWPASEKDPCGDCGVKPGYKHHPGCDLERCPKCKGQIISCSCGGK
jgi:hypothetical protein